MQQQQQQVNEELSEEQDIESDNGETVTTIEPTVEY